MKINAFIGYDHRWPLAYAVAVKSLLKHSVGMDLSITPLLLPHLQGMGLYDRPTRMENNQMWDEISGAPMATEFAISRFLIPHLNNFQGWSLFTDSDFLFRANIHDLLNQIDNSKAIMCVKHQYDPEAATKMDGQLQTRYRRKNWSSMMLINNAHPFNACLTPDMVNAVPGRELHGFEWLSESDIGEIAPEWNWLEGATDESIDAKIVHFTRGTPDMAGYENVKYADEWKSVAATINLTKGA